ncbi:MAG: hypothetical protein K5683_06670 [Prevotella sp.]|nr:hypothetical protein [Prevotella sp.]
MKHTFRFLACLLCVVSAMTFMASCSDDDASGTPEITGVRITNPEKADSLFTNSAPDSTIVIIGRNLNNAQRVYINDQQVWFNSVFNTDHSIIVKIPSEDNGFELTAFNSELKDEIRVETTHGTATYAFKIKAPYPKITRLQGRYPRNAGDELNIFGTNLVDVERIYFTDIEAGQLDSTIWTEIGGNIVEGTNVKTIVKDHHNVAGTTTYETTSQLSVQLPQLSYQKGSIVVQCTGGTVYFPFSTVLAKPTITAVNTDMPVMGETLSVYGTEFVQVEAVKYGDVTLTEDDYTVAESEDQIDIVFKQKPSVGSDPQLTIVTGGGEASIHFYDYSTLLTTFDKNDAGEFIDAVNNGWGPDAVYETTDGTAAPFTADGTFARINVPEESQQWWGTMIFFRKSWDVTTFPLPSFDVIPADATADQIYLAMEVYDNNSDYNNGEWAGYLRYTVWPSGLDTGNTDNQWDNGFEWLNYDEGLGSWTYPILADIDGKAHKEMWYRHVVPLSVFPCYAGKTYADIVALGLENFRIQSINQSAKTGKIDVCFDNVRLYYHKQ